MKIKSDRNGNESNKFIQLIYYTRKLFDIGAVNRVTSHVAVSRGRVLAESRNSCLNLPHCYVKFELSILHYNCVQLV